MRQTLNKLSESYSLFLSKGQAKSIAQEIELSELLTSSNHINDKF